MRDNNYFVEPRVIRRNGKIRIGAQSPQNMDTHVAFALDKEDKVMTITMVLEGIRPKSKLVQRPAQRRAVSTPARLILWVAAGRPLVSAPPRIRCVC